MKQQFILPRIRTRVGARVIDLVVVSIPTLIIFLIVNFTIGWPQKWIVVLLVIMNLLWLISYFIVLPILWHGKTLGKKLFKLCVKSMNDDRRDFIIGIIVRECLIIFVPALWNLAIYLGISFSLHNVHFFQDASQPIWAQVLLKLGPSFLVVWYLSILIYAKLNKDQQVFFDYRFHLLVVQNTPSRSGSQPSGGADRQLVTGPGAIDQQVLEQLP